MKRDVDLIRKILLALEADEEGYGDRVLAVEGYSQKLVGYHCWLVCDAGLAVGQDNNLDQSYGWWAERLTWAGHEFLDAARDNTRWNQAKKQLSEKTGSLSFELIKELLRQLARQAVFGGP